jgi:hypothetical protein
MEDDFMELGDSGLVPISDGWLLNTYTKETIDPEGRVYDKFGEVVFDPNLGEDEHE